MIKLPKHKCDLKIHHNEPRAYYQTVAEYLEYHGENIISMWSSDSAMEKCIETNEIWTMHWYPNTPLGCYMVAAPTLEELLDFVNSEDWD